MQAYAPIVDPFEERIAICLAEGVSLERAIEIAKIERDGPPPMKQLNFGDMIE